MRLVYKIVGVLGLMFLLPVVVLGTVGSLSLRRVGEEAAREAAQGLGAAERARLVEATRAKSLEIERLLSSYEVAVALLGETFEALQGGGAALPGVSPPDLYAGRDTAGLPAFGYVHPQHGAYADWGDRGASCPWIPRPGVKAVRGDPAARAAYAADLRDVVQMSLFFEGAARPRAATLDLVWVVLTSGVTNVWPCYDYPALIAEDAGILDLEEASEDYVRLLDPVHDPARTLRWLEPYLDAFRGTWMTSCVIPLYEADRFRGTLGMDILLSVITDRVLTWPDEKGGYGFLVSHGGRLVAVPDRGIDDLAISPEHAAALRETFRAPGTQPWTAEQVQVLAEARLGASTDPEVARLAGRLATGEPFSGEVTLGGGARYIACIPVGETGWDLCRVLPLHEVLAPALEVERVIEEGARGTGWTMVLLAAVVALMSVGAGIVVHLVAIRPVVRLSRTMGDIRWDRLDAGGPVPTRRDEIGLLQSRFREMLALLRGSRDELTAAAEAQRAAADRLQAANEDLARENVERQRVEDALSREKELLAVTLGSIGDGVLATDVSGRVRLMNRVAEELCGWTAGDAAGRPLAEVFRIISEITREPVEDPVLKVLATGRTVGLANHTLLVARDGTERSIADSAAPIRSSDGATHGVVLVFRDVTERQRLEAEIVRVQKLESVRLLAAGIAHDFNNILTALVGSLSIARMEGGLEPGVRHRLEEAEKAAWRARDLTTQLLTFSTGGAPVRKVISLAELVPAATSFALRGSNVGSQVDLPPDLWPVDADEGQISQVLHNLVINAVEAMPEGGTLRVRARNEVWAAEDRGPLSPGRYVEVSVEDEGHGIPPEIIGQVFDPFFTTRPRGSGLGLAVCFSILARHGGHIAVESAPGQGSTFRFWLPAAEATVGPAGVEWPEPEVPGGRILVMDDEEIIREMAAEMLRMMGYEAETAADGAEAVTRWEEARAAARPFDLVLLDLTVPGGMGGREALRRLTALDPDVRAVVSSGYSHDPVLAEYAQHGFRGAVAKPYTYDDLARAVAAALREG